MHVRDIFWLGVQTLFEEWLRPGKIIVSAKNLAHHCVQFGIVRVVFQSSLRYLKGVIKLVIGKQRQRQAKQSTRILRFERQSLPILLLSVREILPLPI